MAFRHTLHHSKEFCQCDHPLSLAANHSATSPLNVLAGVPGILSDIALARDSLADRRGGLSVVPPTPRLASVDNFRDVAGADSATAYCTASGQKLRRGVIYRSNALSAPSPAAMATLDTLDIRTIFDLRTPDEIKAAKDIPPTGATDTNINLNGTSNVVYPTLTSADESIAYMESSYVPSSRK